MPFFQFCLHLSFFSCFFRGFNSPTYDMYTYGEFFWRIFDEFFGQFFWTNFLDEFFWMIFVNELVGWMFWALTNFFWTNFWKSFDKFFWRVCLDEFFGRIFRTNFDYFSVNISLTYNLLTVASFRIGVSLILFLRISALGFELQNIII